MDEIRAESLPAGRFQKFSEGRTSGEAALAAHNAERKVFRARALNRYKKTRKQKLPEKEIIMLEKMKKILAQQLDLDESEITTESRFKEDLEADSLDLFELLTTLEEQYEIEIPAEDMEQLTTVGAVMDYLKTKGIEE